jgi:hypothetical protein
VYLSEVDLYPGEKKYDNKNVGVLQQKQHTDTSMDRRGKGPAPGNEPVSPNLST